MRNLKKLVALIVTIAMIATFAIPAFAAVPADVVGTDYEGAVTRLSALGVIAGYPNGDFGPNDSITRAQFAAVVVRSLGFENIAASAKGVTKFSDVAASYWGAGYINLAVSLGIIKGYGDGKFGPEDKVSFEQAVTMVVRALGQEVFAEAKGGFPTGFLLQGDVIGFTDGVKGVAGTSAPRGIVAQLIDNAKAVKIYVQKGFGDSQSYEEGTETFLSKLGMSIQADDKIVTQTPASAGLDANTFVAGGVTYTAIAGTVEIESLLGKKVDLWGSAVDKIVLGEVVAGTAVAIKTIDAVTVADGVYSIDTTLTDDSDKVYTVAAGAGAFENLKVAAIVDVANDLKTVAADKVQINFVVDGDSVLFADAIKFGSMIKAGDPVVNSVAKSVKINTYTIKKGDDVAKKVVIVKDGETVDYTAIKDGDILFVAFADPDNATDATITDDYLYIKATSKTVAGTLEAAKPSLAAATSIKVEGTWYDVSSFNTTIADVNSLVGAEITVTLDPAGKVYAIAGTAVTTPDKYGIITRSEKTVSLGDAVYKAEVLTASGDKVIYTVVSDAADTLALRTLIDNNTATGTLVKYLINTDGNLSSALVQANPVTNASAVIDVDKYKYNNVYVKTDVLVFAEDAGAYSVVKWEDITDGDLSAALFTVTDSGEFTVLVLNDVDTTTTTGVYGYTTDKTAIADSKFIVDLVNASGAVSLTTSASTVYGDAGKAIVYTVESDGEITITADAGTTVTGDIAEVSTSRIKIGTDYYYFTDDTIIVYDADADGGSGVEKLTKADVYKDMTVEVYSTGSDMNVLVITAM